MNEHDESENIAPQTIPNAVPAGRRLRIGAALSALIAKLPRGRQDLLNLPTASILTVLFDPGFFFSQLLKPALVRIEPPRRYRARARYNSLQP
jgi:hypothetical protein